MKTTDIHPQRFALEYLKSFQPRIAILLAGYKGDNPDIDGMKLLREPGIQNEIIRITGERAQALADTTPDILKKLWLIASADVTELVQITQGCCRCCWGIDNRHQRTRRELELHLKHSSDHEGGPGYDPRKPPNPECMECFGAGETRTRYTPTDQLSPAARALCAGIQQTAEGPRLKVHSQIKAMEILVRQQHHWLKPRKPAPSPEARERLRKAKDIVEQMENGTFDPEQYHRQQLTAPPRPKPFSAYECAREANLELEREAESSPLEFPSPHLWGEGQGEGHAPQAREAINTNASANIPTPQPNIPPPPEGGGQGEGCAPQAREAINPSENADFPSPPGRGAGERAAPQARDNTRLNHHDPPS